ncbi:hypothetical protein FEE59_18975 [Herbaspirillum sp. RU 5E]|nr:hypothetical protein [Herbaspirillum sp. RU 5E]
MSAKQPWNFAEGLSEDKLSVIAKALLDVFDEVQRELATDLDDNYTRGTTTFGRQKNMIVQLALSKKYDWLDLRNTSNDLTFSISGIPFRFFSDDHEKPHKPGFWRKNDQDNLWATNDEDPEYWRFIVEKPFSEEGEAAVYVVGANTNQEVICVWKYDEAVRVLKSVDTVRPEAVETPEPEVSLPKPAQEENTESGSAE